MRHGDKVNNLGRKTAHRHALMMNLAIALIQHKRIFTTLAKAKALRGYIEPIVTRSKVNTTHNRRTIFSLLEHKASIDELFGPIAQKVGERPGGYTRIIKTGFRPGDSAEMALIELVDFNDSYTQNKNTAKATEPKKRTRRGAGATKKAAAAPKKKAAAKKDKGEDEKTDD
jgi:large subunit ribosomal protein L17